jgi:hypothetical protein
MVKSKYFFEEFKDQIKEEHDNFKTHTESSDVSPYRCDHKGKVKIINNMLRCQCGAGWGGPNIETLLNIFNGKE